MATYISNQTGNWSAASTWLTAANGTLSPTAPAGAAPQSGGGDKFIIRGGHIVTYDVSGIFGDGTSVYPTALTTANLSSNAICLSAGTLRASRSISTSLTAHGNIVVGYTSAAWFDWGTSTDPISAVSATLVFGSPIDATSLKHGIFGLNSTSSDAGIESHKITIVGKAKTRNTQLSQSHLLGTSALSVVNCDGWEIGDRLVVEVPFLSSTAIPNTIGNITNITGNIVTINTTLNRNCPSGIYVGNFSSNITLRPGMSAITGGSSNANSYGIQFNTNGNDSFYEFKNLSFVEFNGTVGGGAMINIGSVYARRNVVFDGLSFFHTGGAGVYGINWSGGIGYPHSIKNIAYYSTNGSSYFATFGIAANMSVSDSVVYRSGYMGSMGNSLDVFWNNIRSFTTTQGLGPQVFSFRANFTNCNIRSNGSNPHSFGLSYYTQKYTFNNCYFQTLNTSNNPANLVNCSEASTGVFEFRNCTLSSVNLPAGGLPSAKPLAINYYSLNNNPLDNRRNNSYYNLSGNYSIRNRGLASYELVSLKQNIQHYFTETIAAKANVSQRFIGYLRYQSSYGTANLPYITFTDDSNTSSVTQTFSCAPLSDTWQKFDLTVTPVVDGNLTMTVYTQTSSTTAKIYLDGMAFDPINPKSRHYGFVFNDTFANQIVNSLTTLSESQVSALGSISNLDELYDAANYWSVTNPTLTSYVDLYTANGTVLDFGNKNIVVNNFGNALTYLSATNTIILDAPSLSAGNNFNTLKTTGTVTLSTGLISNININANIAQTTPTNLNGISMLSGTLAYNTNTPIEIEYTNCIMTGVRNDGTATVTIKRTNSTVTENDAEIVTYAPTSINLTLQGGYIAIYDNTGARQYYQNTNGALVLPSNATGTWSYRIARYGYQLISGSFSVNPNVGGTIDITPAYIPDTFITQSNVTLVSAYADLTSADRIHDYLSYYLTTSTGIDYGILDSEAFGSLSFYGNLVVSGSATEVVNYNLATNTLKIKSTVLDGSSTTFNILSAFIQEGGNTLGDDIKIRATNIDSELYFVNINSITLYPSASARDTNVNPSITTTNAVYRYKYGSTVNGATLSDNVYCRITIGTTVLLNTIPIAPGSTTIDLGTTGTLQAIINNQKIINTGVQKASKLIPHGVNIP